MNIGFNKMKERILICGGNWDEANGKPSGYITKFAKEFVEEEIPVDIFNGGNVEDLKSIEFKKYDVVFWFPNVDNKEDKIISEIKIQNPKLYLISSKNNIEEKYDFTYIIGHGLRSKSNLIIEFNKIDSNVVASVYDPLGNAYALKESSIKNTVAALLSRLDVLINMTRIGGVKVGEARRKKHSKKDKEFFEIVKVNAEKFHELVHGANPSRLMGNCSFRCSRGGFPSYRSKRSIYVSKRNIDKRDIGENGFVKVKPISYNSYQKRDYQVRYFGDHKPSVDTPIQLALYAYFKNIKYMIHSHVYIENAPFTKTTIPCGSVEEVEEIINVFSDPKIKNFKINLKGHGSLIASSNINGLKEDVVYLPRVFPENQVKL